MPGLKAGRGGSLAARREMRDHGASLTRRRIETKPACQLGSYGVQWSTLKENNYECKRYCAGGRSIAAKFLAGLLSQQDRARISACCWRGLLKFLQRQVSHIILQPVWQPPTPFYPLTHRKLAGGLAFVYSCLYSHSPGCTLMFSSLNWRTTPSCSLLKNPGLEDVIREHNLPTCDSLLHDKRN